MDPWDVTVPMLSPVLLSPRDLRAPVGNNRVAWEEGGMSRSSQIPGGSQTHVRALPAGRRAGRAPAGPGGTRRHCRRCTPGSHGNASVTWGSPERFPKHEGTPKNIPKP